MNSKVTVTRFFAFSVTVTLLIFASQGMCGTDLPPTKNAIAFTRLTNGYWQIWTVDPDGNNLVQRSFSTKDKRKPVWKPTADQILFHTNDHALFLFDLATQDETQLLKDLGKISDAVFTPDGKKLIFTRFDENVKDASNLWSYDLETKERTLLTQDPGLQYSPHVSPDGKKIVYVAGKGWGTHEIWLLDLETSATKPADPSSDGKGKKRLTENETYDIAPEFSPDAGRIAYTSNLMGNYDIWLMGSDGKGQHKITKPLGLESSPSWSPDGTRLAIASQRGENLQIWTIDLEGKDWKQLTSGDDESQEPSWRK